MTSFSEAPTVVLNTAPPRLVIAPDVSQLLLDGWTQKVIATIMEARADSPVTEVIIAAPALTRREFEPQGFAFFKAVNAWADATGEKLIVWDRIPGENNILFGCNHNTRQRTGNIHIATREFFDAFNGGKNEAWAQLMSEVVGLDPSARQCALRFISSENNAVLFPAPSNSDYPIQEFCVVEVDGGRLRYRSFAASSHGSPRDN